MTVQEVISVDKNLCKKDHLCIKDCPVQILAADKEGYPMPLQVAAEFCIDCGHCVAVCPEGALSQRTMNVTDCKPIKKELMLNEAQAEQFLSSRRSIRLFKKDPVEKPLIEKLIRNSTYGPSGHNIKNANWIVVSGHDKVHELASMVYDWMGWMLENMPEIAMALHMDLVRASWEAGKDRILRDAPQLIIGHSAADSRSAPITIANAIAYMELLAPVYGLGTCWAGYFNAACQTYPPLQAAIGLPKSNKVFGAFMIGYSKIKYHRVPLRPEAPITWNPA